MKIVTDVYRAGEFAEGLGHYVRVAIVRLLKKYGDLTVVDIIEKLESDYDIKTSYANLLAHIRKLVYTNICVEKKINGMKGLHLITPVDVCVESEKNG